jgi:hypothetical protein
MARRLIRKGHTCVVFNRSSWTFSLETTSQSKLLREAGGKFQEWRAPFASCFAVAQIAGEIDSTFDPTDLAESSWLRWRAQFFV